MAEVDLGRWQKYGFYRQRGKMSEGLKELDSDRTYVDEPKTHMKASTFDRLLAALRVPRKMQRKIGAFIQGARHAPTLIGSHLAAADAFHTTSSTPGDDNLAVDDHDTTITHISDVRGSVLGNVGDFILGGVLGSPSARCNSGHVVADEPTRSLASTIPDMPFLTNSNRVSESGSADTRERGDGGKKVVLVEPTDRYTNSRAFAGLSSISLSLARSSSSQASSASLSPVNATSTASGNVVDAELQMIAAKEAFEEEERKQRKSRARSKWRLSEDADDSEPVRTIKDLSTLHRAGAAAASEDTRRATSLGKATRLSETSLPMKMRMIANSGDDNLLDAASDRSSRAQVQRSTRAPRRSVLTPHVAFASDPSGLADAPEDQAEMMRRELSAKRAQHNADQYRDVMASRRR